MELALLLHLHQPAYADPEIVRRIATTSYIPLINLLKEKRTYFVTLNITLSLLEHMYALGYTSWISDIKMLVDRDQVELTGTGAYHPLLTRVSPDVVVDDIILHEVGLSYFFGNTNGYEGEDGVLIKNLRGFFPPELAINDVVMSNLASLGYEWVVIDPTSSNNVSGLLLDQASGIHVISRNKSLSDALAFHRGSQISASLVSSLGGGLVALDGETFGHHNTKGVLLLSTLFKSIQKKGIRLFKVTDYANLLDSTPFTLKESTWASYQDKDVQVESYRFWNNKDSSINVLVTKLHPLIENTLLTSSSSPKGPLSSLDSLKNSKLSLAHSILSSDSLWWSSKRYLNELELFSPSVIKRYANLVTKYALTLDDVSLKENILEVLKSLLQELEQ